MIEQYAGEVFDALDELLFLRLFEHGSPNRCPLRKARAKDKFVRAVAKLLQEAQK